MKWSITVFFGGFTFLNLYGKGQKEQDYELEGLVFYDLG